MATAEDVLAQMREHDVVEGAEEARIYFLFAQTHEGKVKAVQKAIDYVCNQLETDKSKKQDRDEDDLTLEICSMLRAAGFRAAHDEHMNGHCDVVIRGKDGFLWLAEAKKNGAYSWLDKGFQQLTTRYSTGVPGQDHGEVLLYCFAKNSKNLIDKWREELVARNPEVSTQASSCGSPLIFGSTHKHEASGLDFYVRHKAVTLYWDPKDK
ncbi:hypothetical protein [Rhizobium sp. RM]|uniref:hypothetical protein n=1 Tax=Rhizobium sp. RM TaxID=2748079 RepID=UPI00110E1A03|nr:hypothetical protein [Rhizobium sp. RM]NWJ26117.1 hypothetical protein [Rhizobium sp. RM]TMV20712.1 hypothetical protein BJG94_08430 [Rhizobium sp. Td3]